MPSLNTLAYIRSHIRSFLSLKFCTLSGLPTPRKINCSQLVRFSEGSVDLFSVSIFLPLFLSPPSHRAQTQTGLSLYLQSLRGLWTPWGIYQRQEIYGLHRLSWLSSPFTRCFQKDLSFFFCLCWVFAALCRLHCPSACGILLPPPGIEPTSPAWEGRVLLTGPPGKSLSLFFKGENHKTHFSVCLYFDFLSLL